MGLKPMNVCGEAPLPPPPPAGMLPSPDEERHVVVTLRSGQRITLAEYRRQYAAWMRETGRSTLKQRQQQHVPVKNSKMASGPSPQQATTEPKPTKMLIYLQNGEERLITFTLPKESCTLQEVLEHVNVPFSEDTHIQCMQNTSSEIDYFVSVGSTTRIEELLENHTMLVGDLSSSSSSVSSQATCSVMYTPETSTCTETSGD